ncbi:hypothetical protein IE81DRAFT_348593 [Ceraceosorus guamensis]|uniref:Uncharacterized protein n=1 Tax=Ceraceosorus guamensis TaxID=1522189 RepID=A0A316W0B9_9BASI|nr:hypothetical protein IE81DRAFT_348593 [Ceraceosorus guamensis]PWN41145.1 hypothetical protein IE81DRAFT_348593 [Ceraceosorus guamensis]
MSRSTHKDEALSGESLKGLHQARLARSLLFSQPIHAAHHQRAFFEPSDLYTTLEGNQISHERLGLWGNGFETDHGASRFHVAPNDHTEHQRLLRTLPTFFELHSGWSCRHCASLLMPGISAHVSRRRAATSCTLCGAGQSSRAGDKQGAKQFISVRKRRREAAPGDSQVGLPAAKSTSDRSRDLTRMKTPIEQPPALNPSEAPTHAGISVREESLPQADISTPLKAAAPAPRTLEERQRELKKRKKAAKSGSVASSDPAQVSAAVSASSIVSTELDATPQSTLITVSTPNKQGLDPSTARQTSRDGPGPKRKQKTGTDDRGTSYKDAVRQMLAKSNSSSARQPQSRSHGSSLGGSSGFLNF